MQTNIPEWKPSPIEKEAAHHESIPMFQPLPPLESMTDPGFPGTFIEAKTESLKIKAAELEDELPGQHTHEIKHDHHHPENFVEEFRQMKLIYKMIRKSALEKLAGINDALRDLNLGQTEQNPDKAEKAKEAAKEAYSKAVADFEKLCAQLDNPHVQVADPNRFTNGITLKWASIQPKLAEGGYITGAKVIVRWAGGSHISSDSLP